MAADNEPPHDSACNLRQRRNTHQRQCRLPARCVPCMVLRCRWFPMQNREHQQPGRRMNMAFLIVVGGVR